MGVCVLVKPFTQTFLIAALCCLQCVAFADSTLLRQDWDALLPGSLVQGFSEKPARGASNREARIYVGNAVCASEPNALCYDFRDIPSGEARGYAAVNLPSAGASWVELQLCFYHWQGVVNAEIRGMFSREGQGGYGVRIPWSFIDLVFGGVFTVKVFKGRAVRVGDVLPHVWHRATIRIPPVGMTNAVGVACLERRMPDGSFAQVGAASIPFDGLVLREIKFFDLYGHGPCRFAFDDLDWSCY